MAVKEFVEMLRNMMAGPNIDYGDVHGFYQELKRRGIETW